MPVVNPTKRPIHVDTQQTQTFKPLLSNSDHKIKNIMNADSILNKIKNLLGVSSSLQKETAINYRQKETLLKSNSQSKDSKLEGRAEDNQTKSVLQAKIKVKQPLLRHGNTTQGYLKEPYYNIYDVDKPVTIKKVQKHEEILSKDKQEILNNTLAVYGLRLDPKGHKVILQDTEEQSWSMKKKGTEKDNKGHKQRVENMRLKAKERKSERHFQRKNMDTMKSLWSILKNVSKKWK